jgi:hypothetical protein
MHALVAWLVMLLAAVGNGVARDLTYGRHLTELQAHQLSTVTAILLLGAVVAGFVRRYPPASARHALGIGLLWLGLTVAFEFLFFHYAGGHPWSELLANYDLSQGRVWVLLLLWIAAAPYLFFRFRRHRG